MNTKINNRHKTELQSLFHSILEPAKQMVTKVRALLEGNVTLIGVHVRRTDYEHWYTLLIYIMIKQSSTTQHLFLRIHAKLGKSAEMLDKGFVVNAMKAVRDSLKLSDKGGSI